MPLKFISSFKPCFSLLCTPLLVQEAGQFCCDDGFCIDSEFRCDNIFQCMDSSDEKGCRLVNVPEIGYNPSYPSVKTETRGEKQVILPSEVKTTVELLDIIGVDDDAATISLDFTVIFEWTDSRLSFNYLKNNVNQNIITDADKIWIPNAVFSKLKKQSSEFKTYEALKIHKNGNATICADMHSLEFNETYVGAENPIMLKAMYQSDFICSFDQITKYPFDTERCFVDIFISGTENNSTILTKELLINKGPSTVGQYNVKGWKFEQLPQGEERQGLRLSVELDRNLGSIFLITYLPTILMNLINQAINYSDHTYELLITVNITCMMVLASVYISVSSSLPVTAEIKYVEIWLLFNLAYPVLVILVNIVLKVKQIYNLTNISLESHK